MGLMDMLPGFMKTGGSEVAQAPTASPASTPAPTPVTSAIPGATMQVVTSYGAPPHDQVLTDKIIGMVTETVPDIKMLLAEAETIKQLEHDFGKRLGMIMLLKKFTPAQASDAALALTRALDGVRAQTEGEIATARSDQVERPRQRATELGAQRQQLLDQIAAIDREISGTNERATQAEARLQAEQSKLSGSINQAKAWIDSLARQLTRT